MIIFSILRSLSLGIWVGALLMLGYAVAGPIFQQSPSKTVAGAINGIILGRMNTLEWGCWALASLCSVTLFIVERNFGTVRTAEIVLLLAAGTLLWWYSSNITGRMNALRSTIGDFDHPQATAEYVQAKNEFDTLHHRYTALVGTNMIVILGAFTLSMVLAKK